MSGRSKDESDYPSPQEMRDWAQREIANAQKAAELRTKELADLVSTYSAGAISPEKAHELQARYFHRWGEALGGYSPSAQVSDEKLLEVVDKIAEANNGPFKTPAEIHATYVERTRSPGSKPASQREGR